MMSVLLVILIEKMLTHQIVLVKVMNGKMLMPIMLVKNVTGNVLLVLVKMSKIVNLVLISEMEISVNAQMETMPDQILNKIQSVIYVAKYVLLVKTKLPSV
jgi:hypothetical protein